MSDITSTSFDYSQLDDSSVASRIQLEAQAIRQCSLKQIDAVLETGRRLGGVKTALPHGAFGPWLDAEFGWDVRTAQRYMLAAETFGANATSVSHLPLTVLYQLQAPSVPAAARQEVFHRLDQGERIGVDGVRMLINKAKREKKIEDKRIRSNEKRRQRAHDQVAAEERQAAIDAAEKRRNAAAEKAADFVRLYMPKALAELASLLDGVDSWRFIAELRKRSGGAE